MLKEGLDEEGYITTIASDGIKGVKRYHQSSPDLILLDWMLPGMSRIDVCKEIQKYDREIPILFLTAKDTVKETIEGLRSGANDYIKKPFSFEELLERIKIHLELLDAFAKFQYPNDIGPGVYDINSPRVPNIEEMISLMKKAVKVILLLNYGSILTVDLKQEDGMKPKRLLITW